MDLSGASVAQLLIPVEDLERAVPYYRDVLGLPHLFTAPPQMAFFACGGVRLLVGVPPADTRRDRGATVYFRVPDIHATHATLAGRGVAFEAPPHVVHRTPATELWLSEFRDPDGNHLALMAEAAVAPAAGGVR
jgi:methylmalonyl-CoA/ethylmalonyl-CoA epimerase